jgi:dolichyl-phosphooligosaccharide-protein glycotransferase
VNLVVNLTGKRSWIIVGLLCLTALALRTIPQFDSVFQSSFVNFQETDAWYHVRVVDNLVHHFPRRITVDPYMGPGPAPSIATGPFYDWLLGGIAWLAGFGHPSENLVHQIAAWYPAVLGTLIVVAVFLLGRLMFSTRVGLISAAVIATLPGHFLTVSSLGFTDHHVMESLLSGLFILALLHAVKQPDSIPRAILSGLALAAYLLTFVGGAFFVAIVVAWAAYDRMRSLWPREEPAFSAKPFYITFLLAAVLVGPSYRILWMSYSIAALLLGVTLIFLLDQWARFANTRVVFFSGVAIASAAGLAAAFTLMPGLRTILASVGPFLMPSYFGRTGAVTELQSLVLARGAFTLIPAWRQFAGAYILSIVALFLLGELAIKRASRGPTLLFFWGFSTFILAMGQVRMTYYFAVTAALLSGYLIARILEGDTRATVRWVIIGALVLAIFVPNVAAAIEQGESLRGVSEDWQQALNWIRTSTPEPFGDPAFYYANYSADPPRPIYSVMAWWDYGYWLEAIARRVPVSNPTQSNASVAASFFLAQSEEEALPILEKWSSQYVIVNGELPLLMKDDGTATGDFPNFLVWDKTKRVDDYFLVALEPAGDGKVRTRLLYLPPYYRSMAVRLFVYGTDGVEASAGAVVASFSIKTTEAGKPYKLLSDLRRFGNLEDAAAAQHECQEQGCVLAGENPQVSCVRLEPLTHFRPAFASETTVLGGGRTGRSAVQVYHVLP